MIQETRTRNRKKKEAMFPHAPNDVTPRLARYKKIHMSEIAFNGRILHAKALETEMLEPKRPTSMLKLARRFKFC